MADVEQLSAVALAQGLHDSSGFAQIDGFKNIAGLQHNVFAVGKVVYRHAAPKAQNSLAGVVGIQIARSAVCTDIGGNQGRA